MTSYMWENGTEMVTETHACWMGQALRGETWSQKQDQSCYLGGTKGSAGA